MIKKLLSVLFVALLLACGKSPGGLTRNPKIISLQEGGTEAGNPMGGKIVFLFYRSSELLPNTASLWAARLLPNPKLEITEALAKLKEVIRPPTEICVNPHAVDGEGCWLGLLATFGPLGENDSRTLIVRVEGSRAEPVEFRVSKHWMIEFAYPRGWIDPTKGEKLLVALDLDLWLQGIDLEDSRLVSTVEEGKPLVVVDEQTPDLLDRLVENVRHSVRLYRDKDGDGRLDLTEYLEIH